MIGYSVISEVGTLTYVVLSKERNHVPCVELIDTREYTTL